ncbi:protein SRC2 homolog [Ziziphus jujuba]|uniref:Protein SRC2 homolog n=1 Tax=Ziziphus jujuba TaxID=326968 RepID=A0ABM3IXR6_ZIZJJ|nr:protein SRC2 homolog [Ziziphus jujuba]
MFLKPSYSSAFSSSSMSVYGIQGQILEVTVVGCNKLKDTEWISRQDPYVCLEYASTKFRTKTCTDGGKNPTFQEKFVFTLIEGLRELNVVVGNSNTLTSDGYIGSGKVQLQKVLSQGYDDSPWSLQTKTGRYAGEVRLVLHYGNANKATTSYTPSAPPYVAPPTTQAPLYSAPPPAPIHCYPPPSTVPSYPPPGSLSPYPQVSSVYPPPSTYAPYQPNSAGYSQPLYSQPPAAYPPPPYQSTTAYPPPPYPPPPQASSYYPPAPGPYPGIYPPPPSY